jgi:NADH:ubiquinone oxidoreductase subunit 6 (subunit J)
MESIMSGSGLVQFIVNLISLLAAGGIFFLAIDRVAPDAFFARIAKIAIGALLLIALVLTVAAVFGLAGGVTVSALGVVWFAIAVIVAVAILYIINLVLDWVATQMGGGPWITPVKYILGTIVLIGLLLVAANSLFGYRISSLRSESEPFRAIAAVTFGDHRIFVKIAE